MAAEFEKQRQQNAARIFGVCWRRKILGVTQAGKAHQMLHENLSPVYRLPKRIESPAAKRRDPSRKERDTPVIRHNAISISGTHGTA
jgi:hypothetical protein